VRARDLAEHRRAHPRPKGCDRLHVTAIFVAEWEAVEEIFDGEKAGALQVRGLARTHALQELERSVQDVSQCSMLNAQCRMLKAQ
jgi:hypothetical protein